MFAISRPEPDGLQEVIDALIARIKDEKPDSENYTSMVTNLDKLIKLKEINNPKRVSKEAWLAAGVNLAGILLIIKHEQFNVIATKAIGFIAKMK